MSPKKESGALREIVIALSLIAAAIGVPLTFTNSGYLAGALGRVMRLEIDPALAGGKIISEFADPLGDDAGPGDYEYPLGSQAERGELDLTRYAVRSPITRSVWANENAYWQLEATFAKAYPMGMADGGFRAPVLHVYIDIDGAASGSTESAFGEGELVRFDAAHPWDYAVSADGWSSSAEIRSADDSYRAPVQASWDLDRRRLTLRIGLQLAPALLSSTLVGRATWHYVLVGAYDGVREGHFAALREYAGIHDGGGAKNELSPRVFDLLAPSGSNQALELASEDAARGALAMVEPVQSGGGAASTASPSVRAKLEEEAGRMALEAAAERERRKKAIASAAAPSTASFGELFSLGLEAEARAAVDARLAVDKGDPLALAYRGALAAKSGGRASGVGDKVRLVGEAFRDLDSAVASMGSASTEEKIAILICRGSVSSAVPNDVFARASQGAADLEAATALAASSGDAALSDRCLADAAIAFEKAGLTEEAQARWATLESRPGLDAAIRLELFDRGFSATP